MARAIITKSIIVATLIVFMDALIHFNYANKETMLYFVFKLGIGFAVAYFAFENKKLYGLNLNPFKFKFGSIPYYINWSIIFAVVHGLYYRILEVIQGNPFLSRVGDVTLFTFSDNPLIEGSLDWLIVHGLIFLVAMIIVQLTDKLRK